MKILMVTRGYPQKHNKMLGVFEKDQAKALIAAGHEVAYAVVDIRSFRRKRKFGFNYFVDDGVTVFEMNYPMGPMPRPLIEYFRQQALINLYPHIVELFGRPDIVHAHFLNYGVISRKLCKIEHLPLVITEHSSYLNHEHLPKGIVRRAQRAYDASSAIIAVSEALAKKISAATGHKSIVIPNIADISFDKDAIIEKQPNTIVFASAGRLIASKGFDVLLEAFSEVTKKTSKSVKLVIYGDGPKYRTLIKQAKKLGIEKNVSFYGFYKKESIVNLFRHADVFVLPSRGETFGVVYIEALAAGIPVIATRCGGPEGFISNERGVLVEIDDVYNLANAMIDMLEEKNKYDSKKLVEFVKQSFSSSVIAANIIKVYEEVLSMGESK